MEISASEAEGEEQDTGERVDVEDDCGANDAGVIKVVCKTDEQEEGEEEEDGEEVAGLEEDGLESLGATDVTVEFDEDTGSGEATGTKDTPFGPKLIRMPSLSNSLSSLLSVLQIKTDLNKLGSGV